MKAGLKVFVDSDVVISSLISTAGAAYLLINEIKVKKFVSDFSVKELKLVVKKLKLKPRQLDQAIKKKLMIVKLKQDLRSIKKSDGKYVTDENDSHVVAGAKEAGADFLISYNLKHFQRNLIKKDLKIIIMRPGEFLQFLRSG